MRSKALRSGHGCLVAALALGLSAQALAQDFTAESYLRLALERSPDLDSARRSYEAASARRRAVAGDAWLPSLSAQASAAPWGHNPDNSYRFNSWRLNANDASYTLSASLNLFNSFSDSRKIRASTLSREAARLAWEAASQARSIDALRSYLDLYLRQRLKFVAEEDLAAQKTQYELTQDLYKNGMKSRSDLLKGENDWRSSQLRVLAAEAERRKALWRFNLLIERAGNSPALLGELSEGTTAMLEIKETPATSRGGVGLDQEESLARAEKHRPELRRSAVEVRQAEVARAQALQNLFPSLAGSLNWRESRSATFGDPTRAGATRPYYYLALGLSLPLGYTGYSQAQGLSAARSELGRAEAELRALKRRVREEVHDARIDLEQALESYRVSRERLLIARDNLQLVTQQYRQGSADVIFLSQARSDYLNSQTESLRLLHDAHRRFYEYRLALGEPLWHD